VTKENSLTEKEIKQAFKKFKLKASDRQIQSLITLMDLKENGKIDKSLINNHMQKFFSDQGGDLAKSSIKISKAERSSEVLDGMKSYFDKKDLTLVDFFQENDMDEDTKEMYIANYDFVHAMEKIFPKSSKENN